MLQSFFDKYVDLALALLRELTPRMAISEMGLVSSLLSMLTALTAEHREQVRLTLTLTATLTLALALTRSDPATARWSLLR